MRKVALGSPVSTSDWQTWVERSLRQIERNSYSLEQVITLGPGYLVDELPTGNEGDVAYASNGRKVGEGAGNGTGVLVFYDGTSWISVYSGATVTD